MPLDLQLFSSDAEAVLLNSYYI